jgi:hypothetical protein
VVRGGPPGVGSCGGGGGRRGERGRRRSTCLRQRAPRLGASPPGHGWVATQGPKAPEPVSYLENLQLLKVESAGMRKWILEPI